MIPGHPSRDRTRRDGIASLVDEGEALLRRAAALSRPDVGRPLGRFQLEAAIQSVHCDRARTGVTDRAALRVLYRGLCDVAPTRGALDPLAAVEAVSGD